MPIKAKFEPAPNEDTGVRVPVRRTSNLYMVMPVGAGVLPSGRKFTLSFSLTGTLLIEFERKPDELPNELPHDRFILEVHDFVHACAELVEPGSTKD